MLAYLKKLELDTAKFPGAMPVCGMNQKDMVDKAVRRYGLDALKQTA